MNTDRLIVSALLGASLFTPVWAAPFDTTTNAGTATVGVGGDYASLEQAAQAFNGLASGALQGAWKLEILNDLTEPGVVGFAGELPNGSLTIKPASGTSVTVTFTAEADHSLFGGHLNIGAKSPLADWGTLAPTSNITVDGSNSGSDTRNLTITNSAGVNHNYVSLVSIIGDAQNIAVKNCTLINAADGDARTGSGSAVAAGVVVRAVYDTVNSVPGGVTLHNNHIVVPQTDGTGISFGDLEGNTPASRPAISDFTITENFVEARVKAISLRGAYNGTIEANFLKVGHIGEPVSGVVQNGVFVTNSYAATSPRLTIARNRIFMQSQNDVSGNVGPVAVHCEGTGGDSYLDLFNNMVDFLFTNTEPTTAAFNYSAFVFQGPATYRVIHNSVNMPNFEFLTGLMSVNDTNLVTAAALRTPVSAQHDARVTNNIFRVAQRNAAVLMYGRGFSVFPRSIVSDNNVVYTAEHGGVGISGINFQYLIHTSLAGWQSETNHDRYSDFIDPMNIGLPKWQPEPGSASLHFLPATSIPLGVPSVPLEEAVPTDIDGEYRAVLSRTTPGADVVHASGVSDWCVY